MTFRALPIAWSQSWYCLPCLGAWTALRDSNQSCCIPCHTLCTPSNYTKWFLDQGLARAYSSARGSDLRSHASSFASVQLRALRCARSQQFELDVRSSPAAIDLASLPSNHASQPKRLSTLCHTVPAMCILVCCFIHTSLLHYSSSSPTNTRGPCGPASLIDQRSSY
jgi:hypothetical protein